MKTGNDFNFFIPIEKSEKIIKGDYDNMVLYGLASDDTEDIDKEILEPQGYVVDYFLKNGYINYEHLAKKSPKFIIGRPIEANVVGNRFFVKGKLWKSSEVARDLWDKISEMKEEGIEKPIGWSIEGKSIMKDLLNPKRITKALITNIALTFNPVNMNSWADIVKGVQREDYRDMFEDIGNSEVEDYILEFQDRGKTYRVSRDYKVYEVIKSMTTGDIAPLTPESLKKDLPSIIDITKSLSRFSIDSEEVRERILKLF